MFDWKEFFNDFADRYYSVPDFTNEKHVYALQNYLIEQGMLTEDVDFAIKTLLGEAPTDPKVRDQAKKLGLVSKGYGNWGKEKDGPTTHTNVDGKLEPVGDEKDDDKEKKDKEDDDKPINLAKGGKVDAQLGGDREAGTMDMMDKDDVGKVKKDEPKKKVKDTFKDLELADTKFERQNRKNKTKTSYELPSEISENPKYPKKYQKLLSRMLNTNKSTKDNTKNLGYFMGEGKAGLGGSEANIGELMTMMSTTMRDKEATAFFKSVEEHLTKVKADGQATHVGAQWVKAAKENRKISLRMFRDKYGNGYKIEDSAWDIREEVEKMGMNYDDKGYSTDIYFKVKTPDGKDIFQEVSLKQSLGSTKLHNGSVGSTFGKDYDYPNAINPKLYTENQKQNHDNYVLSNQPNIKTFIEEADTTSPDFEEKLDKVARTMGSGQENLMELVKLQFNDFLQAAKEDMLSNPDMDIDRDYIGNVTQIGKKKQKFSTEKKPVDKILTILARVQTEYGDTTAEAHLDNLVSQSKQTALSTATHIEESDAAKEKVLESIKEKLPLKSVAEGDEDIVMGETALTKKTLKMVFGTSDWKNIKQNLEVDTSNPDKPVVTYVGEIRGIEEEIKISNLVIREDGIGYKGAHKFDMGLDPSFAKKVKTASEEIYGDQETLDTPIGGMKGREPA